jgi:hypothetical protein
MSDPDDENNEDIILNVVDNPVIAYPETKQISVTLDLLAAGWIRVVSQMTNAIANAPLRLSRQLTKLPRSRRCERKLIRHVL